MAPPPPPSAKEKAMGNVMAPIPYDMPRLPKSVDGLTAAQCPRELLSPLWRARRQGWHALPQADRPCCTPSPAPPLRMASRRRAGRSPSWEPLVALAEVIYADVLVELFAKVPTLKAQWQFLEEKVYGVVGRMVSYNAHTVCEPHVKDILFVMIEVWETLRRCQPEEVRIRIHWLLTSHFLPFLRAICREDAFHDVCGGCPAARYPVPLPPSSPRPSPPLHPPPSLPPSLPPIRRFSSTSNTRITRGSSRRSSRPS